MKSPRERLQAAQAVLRNASTGSADATEAHITAFEAYADLAMMPEARAELDRARAGAAPDDATQQREIERHDRVLWLLEGDFAQAETGLRVESGTNQPQPDWLPRFLLQRELGFGLADEQDLRAAAARGSEAMTQLALVLTLLDRGRSAEARAVAHPDDGSIVALAMAAEAAFLLEDVSTAEALYARLLPLAGRQAIAHGQGSLGAVDRYLGFTADAAGRLDDAVRHLEAAIRINERMGARPWQAHAQRDLGALLDRRRATGDSSRAAELRTRAQETASILGMTVLLEALLRTAEPAVSPVPSSVAQSAVTVGVPEAAVNLFRRDGEYWTVGYDGALFSLRDTKGMQYLARLLASPGVEFHVLDLASDGASAGRAADARTSGLSAADLASDGLGDAGEILDPKAREEYRVRLRDLDTELAEAEAWNDPERVARLQAERAFLLDELSAAVGLGGRSRHAASASERARLNVGKTIRSAIDRIETHNAALGRHLSFAIHTGTFCSYAPDPALDIVWSV